MTTAGRIKIPRSERRELRRKHRERVEFHWCLKIGVMDVKVTR